MPGQDEKDAIRLEALSEIKDMQASSSLNSSGLPSPATASTSKKFKLSATMIIPLWICLSSSVIIYNNYLYNTLNFKYPVFTVTWHLTFAVSDLNCR